MQFPCHYVEACGSYFLACMQIGEEWTCTGLFSKNFTKGTLRSGNPSVLRIPNSKQLSKPTGSASEQWLVCLRWITRQQKEGGERFHRYRFPSYQNNSQE